MAGRLANTLRRTMAVARLRACPYPWAADRSYPRGQPMLEGLTVLFLCQLAGEVFVQALGVAFPGPVLGMGLLVAGLMLRGRIDAGLEGVADGILRNLSVLFVPAAVGVVQQAGVIAAHWVAIVVALAVSTVLTLVVTVTVFRAVARRLEAVRPGVSQ